jgi:CBS domain-containing protein
MTTVGEFMTTRLVTMDGTETLTAAARQMRDADIGDVIVRTGGKVTGIITDRDIAVRAVAEGIDPDDITLDQMQTHDLISVNPHDDAVAAADLMRTYAVRRLPVMDDGRLVGLISLGDLAVEREPDSVLADISADEPNN